VINRPFEIRLDPAEPAPELLRFAPPSPELYEELCRAAMERELVRHKRMIAPRFADGVVRLSRVYPDTEVVFEGTLDGVPVRWGVELYRPQFYRMRRGRLDSPESWASRLEGWFAEPLGWLWPETDDAMATAGEELSGMAAWFGAGLVAPWYAVQREGERGARSFRVTLHTQAGDHIEVVARWDAPDGTPRRLSDVAEELREKALRAAGVEPGPERPSFIVPTPPYTRGPE
jgi:hypothetical protein